MKIPGLHRGQATLPLWAQRLHRDPYRSIPGGTTWPASPEEGLRTSVELADLGHRQWLASFRQDHPNLPLQEVEQRAYDALTAWNGLRNRLTFRSA